MAFVAVPYFYWRKSHKELQRYIGLWKTFPTKTLYRIEEMCTMLFMRLTTELGGNHIWI